MENLSIRAITQDDVPALARVLRGSYGGSDRSPISGKESSLREAVEKFDDFTWYGAFDGETLVGSIRHHAFRMNLFGTSVPCGGIGGVAVALDRRKRGVARDLMDWYVRWRTGQGDVIFALHPFRVDFYRAMGFGLGTPVHQYHVLPSALPASPTGDVRPLQESDRPAIRACIERHVRLHHGLFEPHQMRLHALTSVNAEAGGYHGFGIYEQGELRGLLCFAYNDVADAVDHEHDLEVVYWCAETSSARATLLGFLRAQRDQIQRIEISTFDPWFHHHLSDPKSDLPCSIPLGSVIAAQGLGAMWRIASLRAFFDALSAHRWGPGSLTLGITLAPSLGQSSADRIVLRFKDGQAEIADCAPEVELKMPVSEFSSMAIGVMPLHHPLGRGQGAVMPPERAGDVERLFLAPTPPISDTPF